MNMSSSNWAQGITEEGKDDVGKRTNVRIWEELGTEMYNQNILYIFVFIQNNFGINSRDQIFNLCNVSKCHSR